MNPRVQAVTPQPDYTLIITFRNGEKKRYDCKPLLNFGVFQELQALPYFLQAKAEHGTVVWPHEQDICPDTLYLDSEQLETETESIEKARDESLQKFVNQPHIVNAFCLETIFQKDGELLLTDLPFKKGQQVELIVLSNDSDGGDYETK